MPLISRQLVKKNLRALLIWFLVTTFIITLYADELNPLPVSIAGRLAISAAIVAFLNIPFVKAVGRIYLNTTPDDGDLDERDD